MCCTCQRANSIVQVRKSMFIVVSKYTTKIASCWMYIGIYVSIDMLFNYVCARFGYCKTKRDREIVYTDWLCVIVCFHYVCAALCFVRVPSFTSVRYKLLVVSFASPLTYLQRCGALCMFVCNAVFCKLSVGMCVSVCL